LLFADLRFIPVLLFNSEILAGNTSDYLLFCTFNWKESYLTLDGNKIEAKHDNVK